MNPSFSNYKKYSALVGNHAYLPPFANVGNLYVIGTLGWKSESTSPGYKHSVGILLSREKEGEYLGRTKLYLQYSNRIELNERWSFKAGFYGGFYNYSVNATISTGSVSAFAPDASLGVALSSANTEIGVSGNQILNSKFSASLPNSYLRRSINFLLFHRKNWQSWLSQGFNGWYSWQQDGISFGYFSTDFRIWEIISVGVGYKSNYSGILYTMGIYTRETSQYSLKISGSYYTPIGASNLKAPQLELNLLWEY